METWDVQGDVLDLVVSHDVPARMRDGTTLYADIYRPTKGGPFPVILMRLPYDKTQAATTEYRHPIWYARHGYMVVVQDTRGRWKSEGSFYPFAAEAQDGYDSVEWAAALPQANGKVGMYGASYGGATQLQAASMRPPSLRTICPAVTSSQYYEGWAYNGGAFALAFNASWSTFLAIDGARRSGDNALMRTVTDAFEKAPNWYSYLPLNEYPPIVSSGLARHFLDWLRHPAYDDYWRQWSIDADYARIEVPALHIGGWYDIFASGTIKNFLGLCQNGEQQSPRAPQKLIVGPWYHVPWCRFVGDEDFGPDARNIIDDWQVRWFDHFLKDVETDVLESPVTIFLMGENRWLHESSWPPDDATVRNVYLHSRGAANSVSGDGTLSTDPPAAEPIDVYTYDPASPIPSVGGQSCCNPGIVPMGPANQAPVEVSNKVLVYTSPALPRGITVMGTIILVLFAVTSTVDTDFTAKLCDVTPDGRSINIRSGIIRTRYRQSLRHPTLVSPGEIYEYRIDLGPTAHTFKAGHRIRLQVSSSDFPQWDRNMNTGGPLGMEGIAAARVATQYVFHEADHPSHLILPTVER